VALEEAALLEEAAALEEAAFEDEVAVDETAAAELEMLVPPQLPRIKAAATKRIFPKDFWFINIPRVYFIL